MAKNLKGITVEIGGETAPLEKALDGVNKKSRSLQVELRQVEKLLKLDPTNTELLAQKQQLLGQSIESTEEKLNALKVAQQQVQQQFKKGEITEEQYRAFQREIVETENKLSTFQGKLQSTQGKVKNFAEAMEDAGEKIKKTGDSLKNVGSKMSGTVTAPLVAGLGLVTKGTEEFREDLARLEQNAKSAGIGTDTMGSALTRLSGISSETDSNVEALSNLLATGFDEQGMVSAMDALAGAAIKFPDTLKIEGLADGLQETVATGKAIGPFAEMLERLGINLDDFNEGLANAAKSGKTQDYIMQVLADTGLAKVNEQYRKNNEELTKSRESSMEFQQATAELGETLSPIMTYITDIITQMIEEFNNLSPTGKKTILVILGIGAAIGPLIAIIGSLITTGASVISVWGTVGPVIAGIAGPVGIAIAVITALIAGGVLLYKNWDTIKVKGQELWSSVANTFNNMKNGAINKFDEIEDGITNRINKTKDNVKSGIDRMKSFFNFSWSLPKLKVPEITINGKFSLNPPSVPKFGIKWFKHGGIMTSPTMFGFNGLNAMVGGEAGPEAILPISNLRTYIREEMGNFNIDYDKITDSFIQAIQTTGIDKTIVTVDGKQLFDIMSPRMGSATRRF